MLCGASENPAIAVGNTEFGYEESGIFRGHHVRKSEIRIIGKI